MLPPGEPPPVRVESLERPVRLVAGIISAVLLLGGTAAAAYYNATSKLERVADTAEEARTEARDVRSSVAQLRVDLERQRKEERAELDRRLSQMASERAEDRERIIRMEERLKTLGDQMQTVGGDIRVLLDRLNATPRARTARDYP